ncbi:MAG: hypothetical protein KBT10_02410, partial [Bacteroidales bacterium]|nr:hypothetical protein [Candidatus Sodaliphilus aphodohippi]
MLKKSLLLIIALMAFAITVQAAQGTWKLHPKYAGSSVQNLIDAGSTIYFQASKNLFAFDKSTNKVYVLDKDYGMSDATVTKTAFNYDKHYLVVAYSNSNIDIVLQDGTIVNIPDIRDAVINSKKGINDVSFAGGKAYVATEFGLVVIDDNTMQITNTYYYDRSILSACKVGDVLLVTSGNNLYYDTRKNHDGFDKFVHASSAYTSPKLYPCNDGVHFFLWSTHDTASYRSFNLATIDVSKMGMADAITFEKKVSNASPTNVQPRSIGYIANFKANSYFYNIKTSDGSWTFTKNSGGAELYSCYPEGDGTYWGLGAKGLHIKGQTTYYAPKGEGITDQAFWTAYNPNDGKFYLARSTDNGIFTKYSG